MTWGQGERQIKLRGQVGKVTWGQGERQIEGTGWQGDTGTWGEAKYLR